MIDKDYPDYPEGMGDMGFNLSCSCGSLLTAQEQEEYGDICSDCVELGDDDPYLPLDFS